MEKLPLKFDEVNPPKNIKFKLVQPQIMCSLRTPVTGYFRGKIIGENETHYQIKIRFNHEVQVANFNRKEKRFNHPDLQDLKIVE